MAYPQSSLLYCVEDPGRMTIEDSRVGWPAETIELDEPQSIIYQSLASVAGQYGIRRRLADRHLAISEHEIVDTLHYFVERGLAYEEDGRYVSLALEMDPYRRKLAEGALVYAGR